jgi:prepilin-type N-terminal cleavage/methylation domain-containing protein
MREVLRARFLASRVSRDGRFGDESGYSMIEVLAAIIILSLAIIPMVGMFDAGLRAAVVGGNYDRERALANEKLEEIKALPYESVEEVYPPGTRGCPGSMAPGFDCEVRTAYASLGDAAVVTGGSSGTMMQVTVTVAWDGNSYATTGLVSKDQL